MPDPIPTTEINPVTGAPYPKDEALSDFKGVVLLDEFKEASSGNTLWRAKEEALADRSPDVTTELAYMQDLQRSHNIFPKTSLDHLKFGTPYWKSFDKMANLRDKYYLKNLRLYQDNPNHETIKNTVLSGMQSVGYVPWQSIITRYDDQKNRMDIPPAWVVDKSTTANSTVTQIPFDIKAFPYLNKNKTGFEYGPLLPHTTSYFKNQGDLIRAVTPVGVYAPSQYKSYNVRQLIEANNNALEKGESDPRWLDPEMIPEFEDAAPLILGWLGHDTEYGDDDDTFASKVVPFESTRTTGEWPDDSEQFKLNLDMAQFFQASKDWDKIEETAEKEDPRKKYWEERLGTVDFRQRAPLKNYLRNQLVSVLWETSTDEERKAAKDFVGLVGTLHSNLPRFKTRIALDADGSAFLRDNSKGFSSEVFEEVLYFERAQADLLSRRTPQGWTAQATPEAPPESGFYDSNLNSLAKETFRHMQKMMKDKTGGWPKTPGTGTSVPSLEDDETTDPDLYERTFKAMVGLGMEASDPQEMRHLVNLMAQYLRLRNSAALRGYVSPHTWGSRAGATYGGSGDSKPLAWDFERREGRKHLTTGRTDEPSAGWFEQALTGYASGSTLGLFGSMLPNTTSTIKADPKNPHLNYNNDPIYEMVRTFMKDAEKFVVLAGKDGREVVPLIEYMGFSTYKGTHDDIGDQVLPNRVNGLRLLGTDVSQFRNINLEERLNFLKGNLYHTRTGDIATGGDPKASGKSKDVIELQRKRYTGDDK